MLSEVLKSLREQHRYSQTVLANYLNITRQAYNHYETGKRTPSLDTIKKLADFYNISTDVLLLSDENINDITAPSENAISYQKNNDLKTNHQDKASLEKMIFDYVVNKEMFHPNNDSYEDLKKIMAEIISGNENIILEILKNRRNAKED